MTEKIKVAEGDAGLEQPPAQDSMEVPSANQASSVVEGLVAEVGAAPAATIRSRTRRSAARPKRKSMRSQAWPDEKILRKIVADAERIYGKPDPKVVRDAELRSTNSARQPGRIRNGSPIARKPRK